MESIEIWKDVENYEGLYKISNHGRVKVLKKWDVNKKEFVGSEKILTPTDNGHGYLIVSFSKNRKKKNYYVHRLVAEAFIDNPDNKKIVNHKDFNKRNNHFSNLEWCTQKENVNYSASRMRHRKQYNASKTGEKYIYFRKERNEYRIVVDKKEYKTEKTLKEAIKKRDLILKGVI